MILQFITYIICIIFIINILCNNKENYKNNNKIVIYTINGFCNRIRFILKHLQIARKKGKKLIIIWKKSEECPGYFLDYFEPIKDTIFHSFNKDNILIDHKGHGGHWKNIQNEIILKQFMKKIILQNIKKLNYKYIAIHVRVTDLIPTLHKFPTAWKTIKSKNDIKIRSYKYYENFINKYPNYYLYIATDNRETQNYFYKKYKNRIKIINLIKKNNNLRQTSLKQSIIDLYMCIYSNYFTGSNYSSYTKFIEEMRLNL